MQVTNHAMTGAIDSKTSRVKRVRLGTGMYTYYYYYLVGKVQLQLRLRAAFASDKPSVPSP